MFAREARLGHRDFDDEPSAARTGTLGRILRPDLPFVLADDAEGDREAEAGSGACRFGGEERIEDPLDEVWRNAAARILDLDPDRVAVAAGAHRQPVVMALFPLHRLLGIGDEVDRKSTRLNSSH